MVCTELIRDKVGILAQAVGSIVAKVSWCQSTRLSFVRGRDTADVCGGVL